MRAINSSIINWELHLLKVPKTRFTTKIDDPFKYERPYRKWIKLLVRKVKKYFRKRKSDVFN